ncbi:hypothetical protein RLV_2177 (plasmid) [Rhizobium leguminosarum bv. viciae]|nr:hypothetical protein RLV_2177 [Rhizobium leguminosarum bv. viciae]
MIGDDVICSCSPSGITRLNHGLVETSGSCFLPKLAINNCSEILINIAQRIDASLGRYDAVGLIDYSLEYLSHRIIFQIADVERACWAGRIHHLSLLSGSISGHLFSGLIHLAAP